jgi:tetratricopeptide (TPR) repeat protein
VGPAGRLVHNVQAGAPTTKNYEESARKSQQLERLKAEGGLLYLLKDWQDMRRDIGFIPNADEVASTSPVRWSVATGPKPNRNVHIVLLESIWDTSVLDGLEGTEDALGYEPVLWDLKASLRIAQRRFPEALRLLEDAVERFLNGEYPDPHLAGRSLISTALLLIEKGDTEPAIQALKKANGLIDPEREPRLLLCVHHNLVHTLSSAVGRFQEAADLLPKLKELSATHGSAKDRLRLEWMEGRVAAGLGNHDHARQLLTKIRQTFLAESNAFDAALASLDLSISYLAEGKTAEVRELADEMVTIFRGLEVAREPLAALLLFQEAARQETVTADLARDVAASLTKARGSAAKLP